MARGDLPTAFHEAGHVVAWSRGVKIHNATIVPSPEFNGLVRHANPLHKLHPDCACRLAFAIGGIRDRRVSCRSRSSAAAQSAFWRTYHGAADFKKAVDLAMRFNSSDEAGERLSRLAGDRDSRRDRPVVAAGRNGRPGAV